MTKYERFCFNVAWDLLQGEYVEASASAKRWLDEGVDDQAQYFTGKMVAYEVAIRELKQLHKEDRSNDPVPG